MGGRSDAEIGDRWYLGHKLIPMSGWLEKIDKLKPPRGAVLVCGKPQLTHEGGRYDWGMTTEKYEPTQTEVIGAENAMSPVEEKSSALREKMIEEFKTLSGLNTQEATDFLSSVYMFDRGNLRWDGSVSFEFRRHKVDIFFGNIDAAFGALSNDGASIESGSIPVRLDSVLVEDGKRAQALLDKYVPLLRIYWKLQNESDPSSKSVSDAVLSDSIDDLLR